MNKSYCVVRNERATSRANIVERYMHNMDLKKAQTHDEELAYRNRQMIVAENNDILKALDDRLIELGYGKEPGMKHKRINACECFEVVLDFSPNARVDIDEWIEQSREWLDYTFSPAKDKYGSNIVSYVYHANEKGCVGPNGEELANGHLHALIQPIDENGKLNAKKLLGNRLDYSQRQTSYFEMVGKNFGLERGDLGSVAPHITVQEYNRALYREIEKGEIEPPTQEESLEDFYARVKEHMMSVSVQHKKELDQKDKALYQAKTKHKEKTFELDKELQELREFKERSEKEQWERKALSFEHVQLAIQSLSDREEAAFLAEQFNDLRVLGRDIKEKIIENELDETELGFTG